MKTKRKYWYVLPFGVFVASCTHTERKADIVVQDTIPVTLMQVAHFSEASSIEATGVFTTDDETILGFKNGGVIQRIYVQEGDPIRKGQRLATVEAQEVDAKVSQARVGLEKAERDFQRAERLYRDSVATLEQVQNARSAMEAAKQDVAAASYNLDRRHIIARVSGYVLAKLANEGQVVGPGTPVLQVNGAGDATWTLKVGVSDYQWSRIQKGDRATIESDAFGKEKLSARVSKKAEGIDPNSGTFAVYLQLTESATPKLAAGMFGKATIEPTGVIQSMPSAQQIPYEALLEANGDQGYIFVTEDRKTAKRRKVKLGHMDKDVVVVTEGLNDSSAIIVSGSPYLKDGSLIRVVAPRK